MIILVEVGERYTRLSMPTNSQPSVPTLEDARRATETARRRLLIVLRLTYLLLLATAALLPFVGDMTNTADEVVVSDYAGAFILLVGLGSFVVLVDVFTPEKRLANVIAIYFGVVVGLVSAYALSGLIDLAARTWYLTAPPWPAYLLMGKLALGITFCYLAVSIVLATKDDFPQAQFNLAVMLKLGQGTLQDYGEAYKWCVLAELNGLKKAKKYQERLKDLLTEKRHEKLHQEVAKLLEKNIYSGSKKHIVQLSRWLTREPFDDKENLDLALVWALVGSALDLDGATEIRVRLAEDLDIDELEKIQLKARKIFTDPKFQKLYGTL